LPRLHCLVLRLPYQSSTSLSVHEMLCGLSRRVISA
jgi:hypothetical protein